MKKWGKASKAMLLSMALISTHGIAQAEELEEFVLEPMVITATRIAQNPMDVPAGVSVVTSEDLENKGAINLADALDTVPGVIISRNNGKSGYAYPIINGSDQVVVLIDGIRVNTTQGFASGSSGLDLNSLGIDVKAIDKIEVVRGGGSALYGSDAIGGVVQIFTKKGDRKNSYVGLAFGDDKTQQYRIGTSGRDGKFNWRIDTSYFDTDGYRKNGFARDGRFSMRLGQDISGGEAFFKYDYSRNKLGYPGGINFLTPNDYGKNEHHIFATGYVKDNFSLQIYHKDRKLTGENFGRINNKEKTTGILYQDSAQVDDRNLFTWGVDLSVSSIDSLSYGIDKKKRWARAFYVQDTFKIDDKLTLIPAFRYEGTNDYGSKWTPKLGAVYKIKEDLSFFANGGKVFKAPNFDDMYRPDGGNPNLKPESGWTFETGIKKQFADKHELGITYFKRHIKDRIAWFDTGVPSPSGNSWEAGNVNDYKAQGITLTWNTKFDSHWQLDTNYTYVDTDTDNALYNESNHQFALTLNYANRDFKQTITIDALSARDDVATTYIGGRAVVNTVTQYNINKQQRIYLNIYNLFDKKYEFVKYYPANGISFIAGWEMNF